MRLINSKVHSFLFQPTLTNRGVITLLKSKSVGRTKSIFSSNPKGSSIEKTQIGLFFFLMTTQIYACKLNTLKRNSGINALYNPHTNLFRCFFA